MRARIGVVRIREVGRMAAGGAWLLSAPWAARAADADIHDIRGPKALPGPGSWMPLGVLAGALVLALIAYVLWRRHRPQARSRRLTLSEQALADLEKARALMQPATAREFGSAASEVIRRYIEGRFDVVATRRTTEEFLQSVATAPDGALARHRPLLEAFLHQCDFVKFAGASLSVPDLEPLFQSARRFVLETAGPALP